MLLLPSIKQKALKFRALHQKDKDMFNICSKGIEKVECYLHHCMKNRSLRLSYSPGRPLLQSMDQYQEEGTPGAAAATAAATAAVASGEETDTSHNGSSQKRRDYFEQIPELLAQPSKPPGCLPPLTGWATDRPCWSLRGGTDHQAGSRFLQVALHKWPTVIVTSFPVQVNSLSRSPGAHLTACLS